MTTAGSLDLTGHRVLVPGGTGAVGEGVVRAFLAALVGDVAVAISAGSAPSASIGVHDAAEAQAAITAVRTAVAS